MCRGTQSTLQPGPHTVCEVTFPRAQHCDQIDVWKGLRPQKQLLIPYELLAGDPNAALGAAGTATDSASMLLKRDHRNNSPDSKVVTPCSTVKPQPLVW